MKKKPLLEIFDNLKYPECFSGFYLLRTGWIELDLVARLKCYQCGIYKRAILCPPYLWQTYSQFKTFKSTRKFIDSFDFVAIFIWKNDGTKSWKINKSELSHVTFKKKMGRSLKGTESGQAREITMLMKKYRREIKKNGYDNFCFIPGHCDLCGRKCPNRDNPPCKRKGMPSMESVGIDVYKLLEKIEVEYEYPVINYMTNVTMMLVKR